MRAMTWCAFRIVTGAAVALTAMLVQLSPLDAQWVKYPTAGVPKTSAGTPNLNAPTPRTADGKPDFSGV